MSVPIIYHKQFIANPDLALQTLQNELEWKRYDGSPRDEYYCNDFPNPYTYGRGAGQRTYLPSPYHKNILDIRKDIESIVNCNLEVCFLNRYHDQKDSLGWHADDSPEMDDARPIAIVSLGVEREIWFRPKGNKDKDLVEKMKLEHGSLCVMLPGMQDHWEHRIPKASFKCGERISLVYRGYVKV